MMTAFRKNWTPENNDANRYYYKLPTGANLGSVNAPPATPKNSTPGWTWIVYPVISIPQNGIGHPPHIHNGIIPIVVTEPTCDQAMAECEKEIQKHLLCSISNINEVLKLFTE
jgi:hypothetical protein